MAGLWAPQAAFPKGAPPPSTDAASCLHLGRARGHTEPSAPPRALARPGQGEGRLELLHCQ